MEPVRNLLQRGQVGSEEAGAAWTAQTGSTPLCSAAQYGSLCSHVHVPPSAALVLQISWAATPSRSECMGVQTHLHASQIIL